MKVGLQAGGHVELGPGAAWTNGSVPFGGFSPVQDPRLQLWRQNARFRAAMATTQAGHDRGEIHRAFHVAIVCAVQSTRSLMVEYE